MSGFILATLILTVYLSVISIVILGVIRIVDKTIESYCENKRYREGWDWPGLTL